MPGDIEVGEYDIVFRRQRNRLYALNTWKIIHVCLTVINEDIPAYNKSPTAAISAFTTDIDILEPQINEETLRIWHSRHGYLGY